MLAEKYGGKVMERGNFTRQAIEAMEYAKEVAISFGMNYIGTEHLLAGISKVSEGVAVHSQNPVACRLFHLLLIMVINFIDRLGLLVLRLGPDEALLHGKIANVGAAACIIGQTLRQNVHSPHNGLLGSPHALFIRYI